MWEFGHKGSWVTRNWCFWTVVLEMTPENPLDCKEIHPVHPKGDQSWIFIGRTDAEVEALVLWPPDAKNWPWFWERLKAGEEGDNRGWDVWMPPLMQWTWVEQDPGTGDRQGSLACCSSWCCEVSDTNEGLNWLNEEKELFFSLKALSLFQGELYWFYNVLL